MRCFFRSVRRIVLLAALILLPLCASGEGPFDTGYLGAPGEDRARLMLDECREEGVFAHWSEETHGALLDRLQQEGIRVSTGLWMAADPSEGLHGLYETLYGPEEGWTAPLREAFMESLGEYDLGWTEPPFRQMGVRRSAFPERTGALRTLTLFEGELPPEWAFLSGDKRLEEWTCQSGASVLLDWSGAERKPPQVLSGAGLVSFEDGERRQLVQMALIDGEWKAFPLGENALYRQGEYKVSYDGLHSSFAVEYRLEDGGKASFYLLPNADRTYARCSIRAYERVNEGTGEAVWIGLEEAQPTWEKEVPDGEGRFPIARYPMQLGLLPLETFPTDLKSARERDYPGLPEGCLLTLGVNLRARTSSRSQSLGMLTPGTVIPVLEVLEGDPWPWVRTRIGDLEGYVASVYTSLENGRVDTRMPQPLAMNLEETGIISGADHLTVLPKGTKMHVVLEEGERLYVAVPRGELSWLIGTEDLFGWVSKADVTLAVLPCQLDGWTEEGGIAGR